MVASSNPHKVKEFEEILLPLGVLLVSLDEAQAGLPEPAEDADTFEENARIKAIAYARAVNMSCLADDSGLEVDGLAGAPGVRSARYAGATGSRADRNRANNEKLLRELGALGQVDRTARLVCALCLVDAEGRVLFESRGSWEGEIVDEARGEFGFGYDGHLYLSEVGKTAAELSADERNARSHRGQATRALVAWLRLNQLAREP